MYCTVTTQVIYWGLGTQWVLFSPHIGHVSCHPHPIKSNWKLKGFCFVLLFESIEGCFHFYSCLMMIKSISDFCRQFCISVSISNSYPFKSLLFLLITWTLISHLIRKYIVSSLAVCPVYCILHHTRTLPNTAE